MTSNAYGDRRQVRFQSAAIATPQTTNARLVTLLAGCPNNPESRYSSQAFANSTRPEYGGVPPLEAQPVQDWQLGANVCPPLGSCSGRDS